MTVSEIADDWLVVPFVSLTVTDDKCASGTESMFVRNWGGSEQGCLVNKIEGILGYEIRQEVMTTADYESYI